MFFSHWYSEEPSNKREGNASKDFMSHPTREAHLGERGIGAGEKEELEEKQEQWVLESL
jgi:hypothetical protein